MLSCFLVWGFCDGVGFEVGVYFLVLLELFALLYLRSWVLECFLLFACFYFALFGVCLILFCWLGGSAGCILCGIGVVGVFGAPILRTWVLVSFNHVPFVVFVV